MTADSDDLAIDDDDEDDDDEMVEEEDESSGDEIEFKEQTDDEITALVSEYDKMMQNKLEQEDKKVYSYF